ncbi:hypothetical protein FNF27_00687 [Cafeteria roenbergensis]|uniref:Spt4/RpoE2 zinc finger domain-containing protein n=1 Tax=Cafeteria roenbergensis TaxID=33653 RepID=A0A5A8EKI0_CAFRO|nr:hypothetical protein FNF27_00687 [Cafeteria roenbergensis]
MTQLRACKTCRLVKSRRQFHKDACENCPGERPHTAGEREDFVQSHTTSAFTGLVSITNPQESWIAKRLGLQEYVDDEGNRVPFKVGVYAVVLDEDQVASSQVDSAELGLGGGRGYGHADDDDEEEEDDDFIAPEHEEDEGADDVDDDNDDDDEAAGGGAAPRSP